MAAYWQGAVPIGSRLLSKEAAGLDHRDRRGRRFSIAALTATSSQFYSRICKQALSGRLSFARPVTRRRSCRSSKCRSRRRSALPVEEVQTLALKNGRLAAPGVTAASWRFCRRRIGRDTRRHRGRGQHVGKPPNA
jgi:hypothetical protein